jgi:predicted RNase H-like HicB family nuclease
MAQTLAAAFADIAGKELDARVGLAGPVFERRPVDEEIAAAWNRSDYAGHIKRVTRMLAARWDYDTAHDAVSSALVELLERRRSLFRQEPESWMGLLYKVACDHRNGVFRQAVSHVESFDGLMAAAGDMMDMQARPCVPPTFENVDEDARYLPPPVDDRGWERLQMVGAAQRFRDRFGRPPTCEECRAGRRKAYGLPPLGAIYKEFDSFDTYLLEAGMTPRALGIRKERWKPIPAARACFAWRTRNGCWPGPAEIRRTPARPRCLRTLLRRLPVMGDPARRRSDPRGLGVGARWPAGRGGRSSTPAGRRRLSCSSMATKSHEFEVVLQPEAEGGFSVSVPALPGCHTQGETREEALAMARDAIEGYLEVLADEGRPLPQPALIERITVAA